MATPEISTTSENPQPPNDPQLLLWAVVPNCYTGPLVGPPVVKALTLSEAAQWALQHPQFDLVRLP